MWGQGIYFDELYITDRIIPTRVGTSLKSQKPLRKAQDHPHACGDKVFTQRLLSLFKGSSPRVWGQANFNSLQIFLFRIIPTRVGTSRCRKLFVHAKQDHPHACGDKSGLSVSRLNRRGSSPRVWGQDGDNLITPKKPRIIPTRVGTS